MLLVQLLDHEGTDTEREENTVSNMIDHMGWTEPFVKQVVRHGLHQKAIIRKGDGLFLTDLGRELARSAMTHT